MKILCITLSSLALLLNMVGCKEPPNGVEKPEPQNGVEKPESLREQITDKKVEVACAHCVFKKEGVQSCEVAAKVDGKVLKLRSPQVNLKKDHLCQEAKTATVVQGFIREDMLLVRELKYEDIDK